MKYIQICCIMLLGGIYSILGQNKEPVRGTVSFVTSKSIYVKFENTDDIAVGDTLFLSEGLTPCLKITNKSTTSVVCSSMENCTLAKGDVVLHLALKRQPEIIAEPIQKEIEPEPILTERDEKPLYSQMIQGNISLSNYSTLSNIRDDRHRMMAQVSFTADHVNDSKFSFDSYLNYRKNFYSGASVQPDSYFRVYNLSMKYDATPTLSFVLGRNINPKMSSVGAIDGLQVEKHFNTNYIGIIAGFRPDIFDFSFNADLLQYGGYIGKSFERKKFNGQTTVGYIEQRNNNEIDRRYTYLQHSSNLFSKLFLFGSAELDIYSVVDGEPTNDLRLTNLYVSARYRFNRNFNVLLSYDSRKRIIYYETLQTEIERLLDDDIARQGIRAYVNIRPMNNINMGFGYSKRFQSDSQNKSDNVNGYLGLTRIPVINGSIYLNFNVNSSNYLESNIISLRHSRNLIKNRLDADFYYRFASYTYPQTHGDLKQNYYGANLNLTIARGLLLNVSGELSTYNDERNYRIYTKLIKRFYPKRKRDYEN